MNCSKPGAEKQKQAARAREEETVLDLIKSHPKLTPFALSGLLQRHGVQRSPEWVRRKRLVLSAPLDQ